MARRGTDFQRKWNSATRRALLGNALPQRQRTTPQIPSTAAKAVGGAG